MFQANNKDTKTTSLTLNNAFIVNFEHISHILLLFLRLTLNRQILCWEISQNSLANTGNAVI